MQLFKLYQVFSSGQSVVTETRDEKGFTKVSVGVSGNLYINLGPEFKVVIEGDKSILDDILTEVSGGRPTCYKKRKLENEF